MDNCCKDLYSFLDQWFSNFNIFKDPQLQTTWNPSQRTLGVPGPHLENHCPRSFFKLHTVIGSVTE